MPNRGKVKVGIIGSQFEADIQAASLKILPEEAELVAVASPTAGHPEALAAKYAIPNCYHDYREMLKQRDIEMVSITAPNYLHASMTIDIARAGKHVVCEKPLCMTVEEADEMIDVCRPQGGTALSPRGRETAHRSVVESDPQSINPSGPSVPRRKPAGQANG